MSFQLPKFDDAVLTAAAREDLDTMETVFGIIDDMAAKARIQLEGLNVDTVKKAEALADLGHYAETLKEELSYAVKDVIEEAEDLASSASFREAEADRRAYHGRVL